MNYPVTTNLKHGAKEKQWALKAIVRSDLSSPDITTMFTVSRFRSWKKYHLGLSSPWIILEILHHLALTFLNYFSFTSIPWSTERINMSRTNRSPSKIRFPKEVYQWIVRSRDFYAFEISVCLETLTSRNRNAIRPCRAFQSVQQLEGQSYELSVS